MAASAPIELALDQNFPEPILRVLGDYIIDVRLVPLRKINVRLPALDDRQLVIALYQLGYRGLVTNNYKMLANPAELAAIIATGLTVFAIEGVGHDPLRATGALLLDLPGALRRMGEGEARVFWLRPRNPQPERAWDLLVKAASRQHRPVTELHDEVKVTDAELDGPVLG